MGLALFAELRTLRLEIAQSEGLPPYVVFGDKSLADMCLRAPRLVWEDDRRVRHGRAQV